MIINQDKNFERKNSLNSELFQLMSDLSANTSEIGDWKIIKIQEARMRGLEDPYNFEELTTKREIARNRINQIQQELETYK